MLGNGVACDEHQLLARFKGGATCLVYIAHGFPVCSSCSDQDSDLVHQVPAELTLKICNKIRVCVTATLASVVVK